MVTFTFDPPIIEVRLSEAPVTYEFSGDVIADVNRAGNWVRGLEVLGSSLQFSLQKALAPLVTPPPRAAVRLAEGEFTATYDEDADAGFLYVPYASPSSVEREHQSDPLLLKTSYSVEDERAVFGLASDKTLVSIRFKIPPSERIASFVRLFSK